MRKRTQSKRLNKSQWLEKSLKALPKMVGEKLNIDNICNELNVTKGSFYAHFDTRDDFLEELVEYWHKTYTASVVQEVQNNTNLNPKQRLREIMNIVLSKRLDRYDFSIRSLATFEPAVARLVEKNDKTRFEFVRSNLHEIGFRDKDLEARMRIFVVYLSMRSSMKVPNNKKDQLSLINSYLKIFTE